MLLMISLHVGMSKLELQYRLVIPILSQYVKSDVLVKWRLARAVVEGILRSPYTLWLTLLLSVYPLVQCVFLLLSFSLYLFNMVNISVSLLRWNILSFQMICIFLQKLNYFIHMFNANISEKSLETWSPLEV